MTNVLHGIPALPLLETSRVVVAEGEADTVDGCAAIMSRAGVRIAVLNEAMQKYGRDSQWADEIEAVRSLAAAVKARSHNLTNLADSTEYGGFMKAIHERFGAAVLAELRIRAREIQATRAQRHRDALVGSAIPVGAVGGSRRRVGEPA